MGGKKPFCNLITENVWREQSFISDQVSVANFRLGVVCVGPQEGILVD